MLRCFSVLPDHLQGESPRFDDLLMVDPPSPSMRHLCFNSPQSSAFRLDTSISRLLAGHRHDLYRTFVFPQDPRRSSVHQSNCSWYSRLVSHLATSVLSLLTISLVLVVVGWFIVKGPSENRGEVVLGRFGKSTMSSFPVQVFAYT